MSDGDLSLLGRVPKVVMIALDSIETPTVRFQQPDQFSAISLHANLRVR
jgi:hypothetical protein